MLGVLNAKRSSMTLTLQAVGTVSKETRTAVKNQESSEGVVEKFYRTL